MISETGILRISPIAAAKIDEFGISKELTNEINYRSNLIQQLKKTKNEIMDNLYEIIFKLKGDKQLIKIRRKVNKEQLLLKEDYNILSNFVDNTSLEALEKMFVIKDKISRAELKIKELFEKDYKIKKRKLKIELNNFFLYNAITTTNTGINNSLNTYVTNHCNDYSKQDSSYMNYYYRSVLKPSPLSSFTLLQFINPLMFSNDEEEVDLLVTDKIKVDIRINYAILKNILSTLKEFYSVRKKLLICVPDNYIRREHEIRFLRQAVQESGKYTEKISKIKLTDILLNIFMDLENKNYTYEEFHEFVADKYNICNSKTNEIIEIMLREKILVEKMPFNNSNPDLLENLLNFTRLLAEEDDELKSIKDDIKSLIKELSFIKESKEKRIHYSSERITHLLDTLMDKLKLKKDYKIPYYEDFYIEPGRNGKVHFNVQNYMCDITNLHKIASILDPNLNLRITAKEIFKKHFLYDDNVELLYFFEIFNKYVNVNHLPKSILQRLFFNPLNVGELDELIEVRKEYLKIIQEKYNNSNGTAIDLHTDDFFELLESYNKYYSKSNDSRSFYIQVANENQIVVNNILEGNMKYLSRFFNIKEKRKSSQLNNLMFNSENSIELYNSNFFNANVHPLLTENSIGYGEYDEKALTINNIFISYDKDEDNLYLFNEITRSRIKIYDLGFMTSRLKPTFWNFLTIFNQNSNVPMNLISGQIFKSKNMLFPEVKIGSLLIGREGKVLNLSQYHNLPRRFSYILLLDLQEENGLPNRFFYNYFDNKRWTKPIFIDLRNPISARSFYNEIVKLSKKEKEIIITKRTPENLDRTKEYIIESYL